MHYFGQLEGKELNSVWKWGAAGSSTKSMLSSLISPIDYDGLLVKVGA